MDHMNPIFYVPEDGDGEFKKTGDFIRTRLNLEGEPGYVLYSSDVMGASGDKPYTPEVVSSLSTSHKYASSSAPADREHALARLITSSEEALLTLDARGAILMANTRARELFGIVERRSSRLKGSRLEIPGFDTGEFLDRVVSFFRCQVTGEPVLNQERSYRDKSGDLRTLTVSIIPYYENGEFAGVVFAAREGETFRHRSGEETHKHALMLERSRLSALGKVIGVISHQLKQPLSTLSLLIQDMHEAHKSGELDQGYLSDSVENELNQIKFMTETLENFQNFVRRESKEIVFPVKESVDEIVFLILHQLKRVDIRLNILVENDRDTPICLAGYPDEFKLVVLNLIENARAAILKRRAKERLKSDQCGEISVKIRQAGGEIRLEVLDDGTGIDDKDTDSIFQSDEWSDRTEGGLGLYISRFIIGRMGGKIFAENREYGARLVIVFPGDLVTNLFRQEDHCVLP